MGDETRARDEICEVGLSLFSRGPDFRIDGEHQRSLEPMAAG